MSNIWIHDPITNEPQEVGRDASLPVEITNASLPAPERLITRRIQIPGIGAAAGYAYGDAFGTQITFSDVFRPERMSGEIVKVLFFDLDNEGIDKVLNLYTRPITQTTDNLAYTPTDADLLACAGWVEVGDWGFWALNQMGQNRDPHLRIVGESVNLYCQIVTLGADNIAATALPWVEITVRQD